MAIPLDAKEIVTVQELAISNMLEIEALIELLVDKKIVTKEEIPFLSTAYTLSQTSPDISEIRYSPGKYPHPLVENQPYLDKVFTLWSQRFAMETWHDWYWD